MNTWSIDQLNDILPIEQTVNIQSTTFDYLRIVDLNQVKYELTAKNTLFFMTYSQEEDVNNGFIISAFDLRKHANEVIENNPNYTFVIDKETYNNLSQENKNAKLIIVDNILDSINNLYNYIIKNTKAKVIAVTGSVGKTTSVGLIADVLKQKYNVLRVYSKRITPIILKANLINFLTDKIDYIVLEMSIWRKNHVEVLSDLLHPYISALINIDSSHIEYFNSLEDICIHKASIFRYAKYGYYNNSDKIVNNLKLKGNNLYFKDKPIYKSNMEELNRINKNYEIENDNLIINGQKINLYFASKLSIIQTLLAYNIGIKCDIKETDIVEAINNYKPVENRIQKEIAFGHNIIFDGDITTNERIKQLANNLYNPCYLVIRKFGSAEHNNRFEKVLDSFDKFTKVFVFDDVEYLSMLKSHKNVQIVNSHDFMKDINGQIIYHYSGYYRSFKQYDEKNLINIENTIYKIMKMEEV